MGDAMPYTEAQKRAESKYRSAKTTQVSVRFYNATEGQMIAFLKSQENKQGYIKSLIRKDMERQGITIEYS